MAAKKSASVNKQNKKETRPAWKNLALSLTLVPLIAGMLLIFAWALDWDWIGALENQLYIGILFLLLSFSLSNLLQGRWLLSAGWTMLLFADLVFLIILSRPAQISAGVLGVIGLGILLFHFFQQIGQQNKSGK